MEDTNMRLNPVQWTPQQLSDYRLAFVYGENKTIDTREAGAVVTYDKAGVLLAAAWWGRSAKTTWHYRFASAEQRNARIAQFWESCERSAKFKAERKEQRRADADKTAGNIKVGTILSGSWGYDQTNAELYEVVEIHGKRVGIRELKAQTVEGSEGFMSQSIKPLPGQYCGPVIYRLITGSGVKLHESCHLHVSDATSAHYSSWYA